MGVQAPPGLLGIHTNMARAVPPEINALVPRARPPPEGLDDEERYSFDHIVFSSRKGSVTRWKWGIGRKRCTGSRIRRLALAAWIIDHDIWTYKQIARLFDGEEFGFTRDDIVDNITLYWLTKTGVSSARLYWENKSAFVTPKGVGNPGGGERLPGGNLPDPEEVGGEGLSRS